MAPTYKSIILSLINEKADKNDFSINLVLPTLPTMIVIDNARQRSKLDTRGIETITVTTHDGRTITVTIDHDIVTSIVEQCSGRIKRYQRAKLNGMSYKVRYISLQ
jgi:hypothetical protein